jgi:hypothetical protein
VVENVALSREANTAFRHIPVIDGAAITSLSTCYVDSFLFLPREEPITT